MTSRARAGDIPTGEVSLSSSNGGSRLQPRSCQLDNAGRCQLIYVPTGPPSRTDTLTAAYQDATGAFKASTDAATIDIKTAGPPNTIIKKKPRRKVTGRKAKFTFVADQPLSSFQCKLDKAPFKSCRSPFKHKVKPGRHTFQVRATNSAKEADPTPAKFSWRVS